MILKDIYKRFIAIVTLCLFVLSTSGVVLFYHYCQHGHKYVYSMYVDATQELCQENAELQHLNLHQDCCHQETNDIHCCKNHQSHYKTVQLKNDYEFSARQTTPKPITLILLNIEKPQQVDILYSSLIQKELKKELPPEIPLFNPSGKDLVTFQHTLKIAC